MSKQALISGLIALTVVAAIVGTVIYRGQLNRLTLTGEILKVRSHQIDPENTIAVIDLRISNPSPHQFLVRRAEVFLEDGSGERQPADVFSEIDAERAMSYYKTLGEKYNSSLITRDSISPGQTMDRLIAIRVGTTDAKLQARKGFVIVVHDVDRGKAEIVERR